MPAAAPLPRRNAVGNDQNGGVNAYSPIAAIESAVSVNAGVGAIDALARPIAAVAPQHATCTRRSPVRSECAATVIMPIAATVNGTAVHMPTARSDAPESPLTICGRKKLNP